MKWLRLARELARLVVWLGLAVALGWCFTLRKPIRDLIAETHETAIAERKHLDLQLQVTEKATNAAKQLIQHTDLSLNGRNGLILQTALLVTEARGTVGKLSTAIDAQNDALIADSAALRASLVGITDSETQLNAILGKISEQTTQIGPIIENVSKSSQSVSEATASIATMADHTRAFEDREIAQFEKPVTKVKAAFLLTLTALGKFLGY